MSRLITITEAARSFSDIIARVYYRGEEFDIKKGNQIVAHISPSKNPATLKISELNDFFANAPKLSQEDINEFEKDLKRIRDIAGGIKNSWD